MAIAVWILVPSTGLTFPSLNGLLQAPLSVYEVWFVGLVAIGVLFFAGEVDRRDKTRPVLGKFRKLRVPFFVLGLFLLGVWVILYSNPIGSNISMAVSQPLQILAMIVLTPLVALLLIRRQTNGGKQPAII